MPNDNIKILLVDDNKDNLMSIEVVLEKDGYRFFQASSGREALRILLHEEDFSLILLDVKMPVMDGYETAELIYQRDKLKNIPIIFITAHDYEEAAIFKGYQAGAVDFVRKPFNPEILRSKVAIFAELHRKNQLLRQEEEKVRLINRDLVQLNQDLEKRVAERTLELENLNHELKNLNLSKDKFLSVISHDLRNPLTSLLASSAHLIKKAEKISPKELKALSDIIYRTSNNILQQLNELVEWAKKQREKTTFNPEKLHLAQSINESLELLKTNAYQKKIDLKNNADNDVYVTADPLMLRSILQNIVTNAIKYTPHGGDPVEVSAQLSDNMVEICVEDHGIGMNEKTKDMIFGKIDSASALGTNKELGTGLGLLLVRDFVTQHGGTISIESEIDKGTCFRFSVPKNQQ